MRGYKKFIKLLPGPQSYCKCESLCSQLTVEHVVPKSLVKRAGKPKSVANDLHNLYPCCSKLNGDKGSLLFGQDFLLDNETSDHTGVLSRSCLYMYDEYQLPVNKKTVALWRVLDSVHPPQEFEFLRNDIIFDRTGNDNNYITNHLLGRTDRNREDEFEFGINGFDNGFDNGSKYD